MACRLAPQADRSYGQLTAASFINSKKLFAYLKLLCPAAAVHMHSLETLICC